ncbi:carboxypeptidase-like regulatory domain-containing protein [Roseimaritima sediminicola]|uniref:carboxypeptidase-like regulatory domain-containing protein n=1 Tax=Roseimaritima sediminicola TaxID=2662066 RepID=UPI00129840EA|nr:carboxypeptidase-like regulatory domain-containing protein [Roseimaritima sediminicola]
MRSRNPLAFHPLSFRSLCAASTLGLALLAQVGCGGPGNPPTYPVIGTLTQDGKPVADATVSFVSLDTNQSSVGRTDASGNFQLTTFESNDGAVPGEYKVRVFKFEPTEELVATEVVSSVGDDEMEEMPSDYTDPGASREPAAPKNLLPEIYNSVERTPLKATVTEGDNKIDLSLDAR